MAPREAVPLDSERPRTERRARARWAIYVSCGLWLVWLALSGLDAPVLGLVFSALGGAAGAWLVPGSPRGLRAARLPGFALWFLKESVLAGVDVAWRAMGMRVRVEPCFLIYEMSLPVGSSRTLMVGLISLLPGTLSADVDVEQGILTVHALAPSSADTIAPLEQRIARLFGVEVSSSTPRASDLGEAGR